MNSILFCARVLYIIYIFIYLNREKIRKFTAPSITPLNTQFPKKKRAHGGRGFGLLELQIKYPLFRAKTALESMQIAKWYIYTPQFNTGQNTAKLWHGKLN